MRVYHFVNREFGLDDLRRRRLKIATINDLNDPFELLGFSSTNREVRDAFARTKDQLAANRGMLCFSRDWQNPVQWSHYADRHRGLCLGFDLPEAMLATVSYRAKRLEPDLATLTGRNAEAVTHMLQILSTKYSHWRYENEMRCFAELRDKDEQTGLYFADFSDSLALKEVIIGHCSTISRDELAEALGEFASKVSTFKARLAFRSFKVVRQRNQKLWK